MDRPSRIDNIGTGVIDSLRYALHRGRRRTISVEVRVTGAIIVRTPMRMSIAAIESFLTDRLPWIISRLERAREARFALPLPGVEQYYLRGELKNAKTSIPFIPGENDSRNESRKCYRHIATSYFPTVIADVLPALGVHGLRFSGMKLRTMHRRWGSCTGGGVITLNDRLAMTPDHCIRAVVVHELCHLVHMDHGPAFRHLTRDVMPDIDAADADLDNWSAVMAYEVADGGRRASGVSSKANGAQGPVEERTLLFRSRAFASADSLASAADASGYASVGDIAQSWSNELVSAEAIISGVRPSM